MILLTRKRNIGYLLKTHTRVNKFSTENKLPEIGKSIKTLKIIKTNIQISHDLNMDKEKIIRSLDEIQNKLTIKEGLTEKEETLLILLFLELMT